MRYRFDDPVALARSLEGASTLYNTYWVRFAHGTVRFADAVDNSRLLFDAARPAGVERIVHVSITNPSIDSPLPYFAARPRSNVRRPVAVDDVARLCVELGTRSDDAAVDAVGPETFSFRDMVRMIRDALGAHTALVRAPRPVVMVASRILSAALRDV